MPVYFLDQDLWFPPVDMSREDGLLAVGGDLAPERLLLAYSQGIFPWYNEDEPPMWWSPDPRFVLFPNDLAISKSMNRVLKKEEFQFKINTAFTDVITNCSEIKRKGMDGTWIGDDVINAYTQLHIMGYAYSGECWYEGELVGGLYGIRLGNVFFGESMFSKRSNASKFAFINMVKLLALQGVVLVDCQVYTAHLASLGAQMIPRKTFVEILGTQIN